MSSSLVNFLLDIQLKKFTAYVIIYLCDKWLSQHIKKEFIQEKKLAIVKNSKKEKEFINKLRNRLSCIETTNILN